MTGTQFDLVIVGVGGQGTLLSSKIIGRMALDAGLFVKVSEVHGMAQRGGSVITHVRVGDIVYAPLVSKGGADYVVAFEELEGARSADFIKPGGVMIVNAQKILPMPVITGSAAYPEDPLVQIREVHPVIALDALSTAVQAGDARAVNLVLLGVLAQKLPFEKKAWVEAITASVPQKTLETNLKAFEAGLAH